MRAVVCESCGCNLVVRDMVAQRTFEPSLLRRQATLWPALERLFVSPCPHLTSHCVQVASERWLLSWRHAYGLLTRRRTR